MTIVHASAILFLFAAQMSAVEGAGLVALDPATAGPDFAVQGEYQGGPEDKLGVQVIALGDGEFRVCVHAGGLPGAGWDGQGKVEIAGKADGRRLAVDDKGWTITIGGDGSSALAEGAQRAVKLQRVQRQSPTMGMKPPVGALVLFDGTHAEAWEGSMDERHLLKYGADSKRKFTDFTLHIEFMLPFKPHAREQDRGNSGVYFQERYECQVLDSFGLSGEHNECGGIYSIAKPKLNMCFPPLSWQTYDADFTAARWDGGRKTANAKLTLRHNGVLIHDHLELPNSTGGGMEEGSEPGGIHLQDHGNPVFYRNIWLLEAK